MPPSQLPGSCTPSPSVLAAADRSHQMKLEPFERTERTLSFPRWWLLAAAEGWVNRPRTTARLQHLEAAEGAGAGTETPAVPAPPDKATPAAAASMLRTSARVAVAAPEELEAVQPQPAVVTEVSAFH